MKINIEDIEKNIKYRKKVNKVSLNEIEFYKNNKKINIDPKIIEEFEFVGLNNIDFITTGYYKGKSRIFASMEKPVLTVE